jgi:hypothetical protein
MLSSGSLVLWLLIVVAKFVSKVGKYGWSLMNAGGEIGLLSWQILVITGVAKLAHWGVWMKLQVDGISSAHILASIGAL